VFTLVSDAPLDQKNGSSCQVDCSSLVASNAIPQRGGGQGFRVGLQLRPRGGRGQVRGGEHGLVVEQPDRVGPDRVAVVLALVGALTGGPGRVAGGGEPGHGVQGHQLAAGVRSATFGLSISIRFGMSPALASCRIFVIRFAYGTEVRLTTMFGCAFMNWAL
jgi:hypothetical protein